MGIPTRCVTEETRQEIREHCAPGEMYEHDGHWFPRGFEVDSEIPAPEHNWADIAVCLDCNRAWIRKEPGGTTE